MSSSQRAASPSDNQLMTDDDNKTELFGIIANSIVRIEYEKVIVVT